MCSVQWISDASAQTYRQIGLGISGDSVEAFSSSIANLVGFGPTNPTSLIGHLPGEWYVASSSEYSPKVLQNPNIRYVSNVFHLLNRTLPVCDGGMNWFENDWSASTRKRDTLNDTSYEVLPPYHPPVEITAALTPCACGYQGNETALIWNMTGSITKFSYNIPNVVEACHEAMSNNNNQGWLAINGGPPPNGEITIGPGNTYTYTSTSARPTATGGIT